MKVILLNDVKDLGRRGEVHEVSTGFARNYLLKNSLAKAASGSDEKAFKDRLKKEAENTAKDQELNKQLASRLQNTSITIIPSKVSSAGKLFGSISEQEVAKEMQQQLSVSVKSSQISLPTHIKKLGTYTAQVQLGSERAEIQIIIKA